MPEEEKTPEPEKKKAGTEPGKKKAEPEPAAQPEQPKPDPLIVRQQQLQQEYEQLSRSLLNYKQQKAITDDMIYNTTIQMAGVQRAAKELARLQEPKR